MEAADERMRGHLVEPDLFPVFPLLDPPEQHLELLGAVHHFPRLARDPFAGVLSREDHVGGNHTHRQRRTQEWKGFFSSQQARLSANGRPFSISYQAIISSITWFVTRRSGGAISAERAPLRTL